MYQNHIRTTFFEYVSHSCKHTSRNIIQILSLSHDVEIVVRLYIKDSKHLVKHLSVLTCNTYYSLKLLCVLLKFLNQWTHLNGFRACAKNQHYCFHRDNIFIAVIKSELIFFAFS